jgi:hypothetical protein
MSVWYCTREDVKSALDIKETARSNAQIDRAIEASSRTIEGILHRRFYPEVGTKYFDWPQGPGNRSWRIWLEDSEIVSLTSLTAGGVPLLAGDILLEPANQGPPYDRIETNQGSSSAFAAGNTQQRAVAITGVFSGCAINEDAVATLTAAPNSVATVLLPTSTPEIGVGSLLRIDTERVQVTGRQQISTGQTLGADLTANVGVTLVPVSSSTGFAVGETILVDAEYMWIVDIAGNNLVVKRGWDGSTLSAHTNGATVYAARSLLVRRGLLGTVAASHLTSAPVYLYRVPPEVRTYAIAETLNTLLQERSGYAITVGSGDNAAEATGRALRSARADAITSQGRQARMRTV